MKQRFAITYLVICIPTLGWLLIVYSFRNTYFRRVISAIEQGSDPYREAVAGGESLASHLFGPALAVLLLSVGLAIIALWKSKE